MANSMMFTLFDAPQISEADRQAWATFYRDTGQRVYWTQGKLGDGVAGVKKVRRE
jgi:hypothetical protein